MAKSQNGLTEIQIFKRIKEGRGQGSGTTYKCGRVIRYHTD